MQASVHVHRFNLKREFCEYQEDSLDNKAHGEKGKQVSLRRHGAIERKGRGAMYRGVVMIAVCSFASLEKEGNREGGGGGAGATRVLYISEVLNA